MSLPVPITSAAASGNGRLRGRVRAGPAPPAASAAACRADPAGKRRPLSGAGHQGRLQAVFTRVWNSAAWLPCSRGPKLEPFTPPKDT